jgi:hypothetical protein
MYCPEIPCGRVNDAEYWPLPPVSAFEVKTLSTFWVTMMKTLAPETAVELKSRYPLTRTAEPGA